MSAVARLMDSTPGHRRPVGRGAIRPTPTWGQVARSQHMVLLQSGRVWFLLGLLSTVLIAPDAFRLAAPRAYNGAPLGGMPAAQLLLQYAIVLAPIWALTVWRAETRGRRTYHWSLPVRHPTHDLWRVIAGATWLIAMLIAIMPLAAALAVIGDTPRLFLFGAEFWINLITLPLLVYLVFSLLPLLTHRPVVVGLRIAIAGFGILYLGLSAWRRLDTPTAAIWAGRISGVTWPVTARFGLHNALVGGVNIADLHAFEVEGLSTRGMSAPSTSEFLIATTLWLALAAVAVAIAARRSPP